ncbi:MAG: hypothetical protein MRZ79_15660 [Bacteroidia bacterium]|nr:hypothetical protein [Bacteroidia bacterium]
MADSFARFWQNWNPLFSYFLLYYCYKPLKKYLPKALASWTTFILSGAIHDLAASLMLGRPYFLFSLTFSFFGLFVIIENALKIRLPSKFGFLKVAYHISLILISYLMASFLIP